MKISAYLAYAGLSACAIASPLDKRDQTWCNIFGTATAGPYTLYHNNWGTKSASSGHQCTTFSSLQGDSVAWSTSWSWQGGQGSVKSYSNVGLANINKRLTDVRSIHSKWSWGYTGSNVVADVAYDLWLAPSVGAPNRYEIMIWLGALGGAFPISQTGRTPVASAQIAGQTWNLYMGPNGGTTVFSFVATRNVPNFDGDLNSFISFLTQHEHVPNSSVVTAVQAGTEPFEGSNAVFTSTRCSISVS